MIRKALPADHAHIMQLRSRVNNARGEAEDDIIMGWPHPGMRAQR